MSGYDTTNGSTMVDGIHDRKSSFSWPANQAYESGRSSRSSMDHYGSQTASEGHNRSINGSNNFGLDHPHSSRQASVVSSHSLVDMSGMLPEVKSFNPERGTGGTHIHIYLRCKYDLFTAPSTNISLFFGNKSVLTDTTKLESQGFFFEFIVLATAPRFADTGSSTPKVSLRLQLQDANGRELGDQPVGDFEYVMTQQSHSSHEDQTISRKRKMSEELSQAIAKAPPYSSYAMASNASTYTSGPHTTDYLGQRALTSYGTSLRNSARSAPLAYNSHSMLQSPPQATSWTANYSLPEQTPELESSSMTSLAVSSRHPEFVRTTTLQHTGSPGNNNISTSPFNSHNYPQKAVLKLQGDLNTMTEDWTTDEWTSKRRLVQFTRSQHKSAIQATFAPVAPEDRQLNSICVSCIYWEEREEFFATSVDTIYLLEQLVAVRFTVEEKNRIRRNLEGFHPETVSKGKSDSEEFFKLIMGFPNPKPRNIEKDVKVFPWKIIGHALKKIISKYSASYSSPSGPLGRARTTMTQNFDHSLYDSIPGSGNSIASNYATSVASNISGLSNHFSEPRLSGIPSLTSDYGSYHAGYDSSAQSTPYLSNNSAINAAAAMAGMSHSNAYNDPESMISYHSGNSLNSRAHYRAGSASEVDAAHSVRPYKRPRANTSNGTTLYTQCSGAQDMVQQHHHHHLPAQSHPTQRRRGSTSASPSSHYLTEMAHSYSDHGTSTPSNHYHHHHRQPLAAASRLPSLNEGYAMESSSIDPLVTGTPLAVSSLYTATSMPGKSSTPALTVSRPRSRQASNSAASVTAGPTTPTLLIPSPESHVSCGLEIYTNPC